MSIVKVPNKWNMGRFISPSLVQNAEYGTTAGTYNTIVRWVRTLICYQQIMAYIVSRTVKKSPSTSLLIHRTRGGGVEENPDP